MSFNNLNESSPTIRQPKGLNVDLRSHQLTSIAAMKELEKQGRVVIDKPDIISGLYITVKSKMGDTDEFVQSKFIIETNSAILADKVGSGKTYMVIGLILNSVTPKIRNTFVMGSEHFSIKMKSVKETIPVNLIVVPHNLSNQWSDFLDNSSLDYLKLNTISDFNVFFDIKNVSKKKDITPGVLTIYNIKKKKKNKNKSKSERSDKNYFERKTLNPRKIKRIFQKKKVFLLNVNRYRFFKQIFKSIKWARVIIDEMDSANIPANFNEFGNFNWFLTATPTSIFYKSCRRYTNKIFGEYKDLIDYFIIKNNDNYVDLSIELPKPHAFMITTRLRMVVSAIQDLISEDILQLINAGNLREAISKLNCNVDTEENIIKVLTDKIYKELHNLKSELKYVQSIIPNDINTHNKRIEKLKTDIGRCNTRLETVKERISSINNECCLICADTFDTPTILDCCKNVFCLKCLLAAINSCGNKCPVCRHEIKNNKEYHVISVDIKKTQSKDDSNSFNNMTKEETLQALLTFLSKNVKKPRILIFSDYFQTFDNVKKNVVKSGLKYSLISGTASHITNTIEDFRKGNINVLMLNANYFGSGLNLQKANYVILYHRMTPELEIQIIGRAQRFGRKTPLKIIYLVNNSENEITPYDSVKLNSIEEFDSIIESE